MPEGHTVHRLARRLGTDLGGRQVLASSPQGRFADGAAQVDGSTLVSAEAAGKHLFLGFSPVRDGPADRFVHVHLGLYGAWRFGPGEPPAPRGALRLLLRTDQHWAELRGPTACELLVAEEVQEVRARLGPDPLVARADGALAGERVRRSRAPVGALLMDQKMVAGVGNVYRAEVLFRARIDPWRPGRAVEEQEWKALWNDLVTLMRAGVASGRIVTTRPADRPEGRRRGAVRREDAHYVYRRAGLPCRVCGTEVVTEPMVARNLFRCPSCQV